MASILLAEDDDNLRLLIEHRLKPGYDVLCARDGVEALEVMESHRVDLLIADIMMPRMDGFELVRNLRLRGFDAPVMMLTANQTFDAKRTGFRVGTDDYMTKPVDYEELLWRLRALLRRSKVFAEEKVRIGGLVLDSATYTIGKGGSTVELPKKEFDLLFKLLSSPGRIFTKSQLMEEVWGHDSESGEETIKTHISRLRGSIKHFDEVEIVAVKGIGYKAEAVRK
jgi:DNA-binding response OmpR family regulator